MTDLSKKHADRNTKWRLAGAVAAAVGVSVCCVGPLLLLALGVGSTWVGNLTAMEEYRPIWTVATFVFLGLAFVRVYRKSKEEACALGTTCSPTTGGRNKFLLWIVTALVLGLLAFPYLIQHVPYAFAGSSEDVPVTRQVTLSVRNMTCGACTVTVKMSLARVHGVRDAKVTLDPPWAVITYDPAKVGPERLIEATTQAGFPSKIMERGTPQ
jgi:mercuric ion transport protein